MEREGVKKRGREGGGGEGRREGGKERGREGGGEGGREGARQEGWRSYSIVQLIVQSVDGVLTGRVTERTENMRMEEGGLIPLELVHN